MKKSVYLLCLLFFSFMLQANDFIFSRITPEDGLSSAEVTCFLQDKQGFFWIGTSDGLNRYDGYDFKIFRHIPGHPENIQGNVIDKLFEDGAGNIWIFFSSGELSYYIPSKGRFVNFSSEWMQQQYRVYGKPICFSSALPGKTLIGTENGLLVFDHSSGKFKRIENSRSAVSNSRISCFYEADDNTFWVGTLSGFSKYDPKTNDFRDYAIKTPGKESFPADNLNGVDCIYKDRWGYLWIGTGKRGAYRSIKNDGSMMFQSVGNPDTRIHKFLETRDGDFWIGHRLGASRVRTKNSGQLSVAHFFDQPEDRAPTGECHIKYILEDKNGLVWFGNDRFNQGQFFYDPQKGVMKQLSHQPENPYSISSNQITCLYIDRFDNLWMGHSNYGLSRCSLNKSPFNYIFGYEGDKTNLSSNHVLAVCEDSNRNLWAGTMRGLDRIDGKSLLVDKKFQFNAQPSQTGLNGKVISSIAEDVSRSIWVGYLDAAPDHINQQSFRVIPFSLAANAVQGQPKRRLARLCTDNKGEVWFTTSNAGLIRYSPVTNKTAYFSQFTVPRTSNNNSSYSEQYTICADKQNHIWIGTDGNGLRCFDIETETFTDYLHSPSDTTSLSSNQIRHLFCDSGGTMWIGTNAGLDRYNRREGAFQHFTTREGLAGNIIRGILEAEEEVFFVSTHKGLSRLDTKRRIITNYSTDNGLLTNEFIQGACLKRKSGALVFGTNKGLLIFDPSEVVEKGRSATPALLITDVFAQRKRVTAKKIIIPYSTSKDLRIDFIAFNYEHPQATHFRYRLINQDTEWKETDANHRYAFYNQLHPGKYRFEVKASEDGDTWSKPVTLSIEILPPWWLTWWFISLASILFFLLLYFFYKSKVHFYKLREQELEQKVSERTHSLMQTRRDLEEKEKELAKLKAMNEQEREFVCKMTQIVEDNLQNPQFDVDMFCSLAAMSRANLFRKLKATTGHSASAFTREIRIRQALQLLKQHKYTVNEVAFLVGFSDPNYFSRCFKEMYGVSPSNYI